MRATSISGNNIEEAKRREQQYKIDVLKKTLKQPVNRDGARRGSVAISLTYSNMSSEVAQLRRKQMFAGG